MDYTDDGHAVVFGVDAIDDSVGTSAGAVPIIQGKAEWFSDSVRIIQQRTDDELVGSTGIRLAL